MSRIDYRDLLRRYIAHVGQCEGVNFISDIDSSWPWQTTTFSNEEAFELEQLAAETPPPVPPPPA